MKKFIENIAAILAIFLLAACSRDNRNEKPFGVNIACAEFGTVFPGKYGVDYTYPSKQDLLYWRDKGLRLVRLPFKWERLQPELGGELNRSDLNLMKDFIAEARDLDMQVLLDLHNYCRRYFNGEHHIIGCGGVQIRHYAEFWKLMAAEMKEFDNIYGYGLMNEPHDLQADTPWFDMAQTAIDSIRTVDNKTAIFVGGDNWSSACKWIQASDTLKHLVDPADNIVFEAHCYFDKDNSGTYKYSYSEEDGTPQKGVQLVTPFIEWLKANNLRGFIGEYGIPQDDPDWEITLDNFLAYIARNGVNGTYWASGPWWPEETVMTIPAYAGGKERSQVRILEKYKNAQEKR